MSKSIHKCVTEALKNGTSYLLFDYLNKHITPILKKSGQENSKYLNSFFLRLSHILFNNISVSDEQNEIWEEFFPKDWKITLDTYNNSIVAKFLWHEFWNWGSNRIIRQTSDYDKVLEDVSTGLFPETDPKIWADILIFLWLPWSNNRMESVIKSKKTFGFIGRVKNFDKTDIEDNSQDDFDKTIELALKLGGHEFSLEKLKEYLNELEKYPDNERALRYKKIFKHMKKIVDKN